MRGRFSYDLDIKGQTSFIISPFYILADFVIKNFSQKLILKCNRTLQQGIWYTFGIGRIEYISRRSQMFFRIGALNKFAIFTGKHLCWSRFLIKLPSGLKAPTQMFSCEYCKIFKNSFFYRTPSVAAYVNRIGLTL